MAAVDSAAREALAGQAARNPEDPFLFFRDPRGPFAWWSWRHAAAVADGEDPGPRGAVPEALLLAALAPVAAAESRLAELLAAKLATAGEREIWLSSAPLEERAERIAARAALIGGWAVVREPGERLHPETVLWARPTLIVDAAPALLELAAAIDRRAPRLGRARWLRRRLGRLRHLLVTAGDPDPVGAAFAALGAPGRVLPFPPDGW